MPLKGPRPHTWVFPHDEVKTEAYMRYLRAKAQAKFRMEHWDLTFDQWWACWSHSGHWNNKSNRKTGHCMIKRDPDLGWIEDNIEIISRDDHLKTQHQRRNLHKNTTLTWNPEDLKFRCPVGTSREYKRKRTYGKGD